jgi:tetraacyldisaccharide 4'-kinase
MREPAFWRRKPGLAARLLAPLSLAYGAVAGLRLRQRGRRAGMPVVCIGNFTVGGAGKTPTALAVARMLAAAGERPVFLSRGYGGRLAGPVLVDPARHAADDVGDEPLLLARAATAIVARARVEGAALAAAAGAGVVVMDDGFQNPSLAKDFSVLVVDGQRGIGNGRVIPAGPLRAPFKAQLARAHALVVVGTASGAADVVVAAARAQGIPVFAAWLRPDPGFVAALGGGRVLAFAGIGDPQKFFATLVDAGIPVATTRSFADHHRYTKAEAQALCDDADRDGLILVTTEKDHVRLTGDEALAELAAHAHALPVALALEDEETFRSLLLERLAEARRRAAEPS